MMKKGLLPVTKPKTEECRAGFALKVRFSADSALPPDVRRWLCHAVEVPFTFSGYAPGAAFGTTKYEGAKPGPGHSPA